jgi:DNA ligase D-like protein (predicted ligase)
MLAKPGQPFESARHVFEVKWDGTRTLAFVERLLVRLVNRRRIDMTERYPELGCLRAFPRGTVLDGEVVVFRYGKPDFAALQSREHTRSARKVKSLARSLPATYIVFDLLFESFVPILGLPLAERRERLERLVSAADQPGVVFSQGVIGPGIAFFEQTCKKGLEGVMAKQLGSRYLPGKRSSAWLKIKRAETVTCLIVGFVPSGRHDFGSLILAAEEKGRLQYVGKVGTGFDRQLREELNGLLRARLRDTPVVPCKTAGKWVEPGLYCTVRCMERTRSGGLRAPSFGELHVG